MLGRLRFDVSCTAGRRYPELAHSYRDAFQRDRDRVIHSRAFRRLENKTQVFPAGLSDHFRNRLTHTIEVAQISRTIAAALGLNTDLTEALALVHDIGHPPFAHAGEEELDRQMHRFGDHFDHNVHALRIVERFEHRYARFPGLNLTFEVREGIVKHSRDLVPGASPELDEYLPELRPPLEAQLIDLCDEIAYNSADIDDASSAGLLGLEDLRAAAPRFNQIYETVEMQYPGASERVRLDEVVRATLDWLATSLINGTIAAAEGIRTVEEIRHHPTRIACYTEEAALVSRQLKTALRRAVYQSNLVMAERSTSTEKVARIFAHLLEHPEMMPEGYLEDCAGSPLHRTVCDYIAGMTDGFLERSYELVFGRI